ncbi:maltase 1-like [Toxorhynchites rutilus septentrionalis]|uniref:maltase 1-like n=1 Tax=Toxorhynchites rutilus septentrionalis TaxID=329112 RepID=UPI00247ACA7E|nr:maltase 1-like [Toxorhynchites rutilus septentrionalis]
MKTLFLLSLVLPFVAVGLRQRQSALKDWWETALFYQIYPRSFYDTNGDGIGDIKGITAKLRYLKETGIDAAWLSPVFKSPQRDFGYDVSDFREVDELFGSNDDLEELFAEAGKYGIRIILDFVPNHSSTEHPWFKQSELRQEPYKDYYVWHPGKPIPGQEKPDVPNNWNSVFYGSAWAWSNIREEYYLHQFEVGQPDLNFRNPAVIAEFDEILRFWMEKGASGFRVDAVNHMFEDELFRDEPVDDPSDPLSYGYTNHMYTNNLLETYDVIGHWRRVLDSFAEENNRDTIVMMTEAYTSMDMIMRFYESDNGTEQRAHFPFNFAMITDLNEHSEAIDFKNVIDRFLENIPRGKVTNWVLGNHDQPRVGSRYGPDRIDGLLLLLLTLPGVAVTYNGEEIGMLDFRDITYEDSRDPQGCNVGSEEYKWKSRDPQRTPFQWDDSYNAGFSNASKTWLPIHPYFRQTNLLKQMEAEYSTYKLYVDAVKLRKNRVFTHGLFKSRALTENVFGFARYIKDQGDAEHGSYAIIIINMSNEKTTVDLYDLFAVSTETVVRLAGRDSHYHVGQQVNPSSIPLGSYESLVIMDSAATTLHIAKTMIMVLISRHLFT